MEPLDEGEYEFVDRQGGVIPREFIPSCDKGFRSMLPKGRLIEAPVTGVLCGINDGKYHAVDSSDVAFQEAARGAWRDAYARAKPVILEPVMKVSVEGPSEFQGSIIGTMNQRRGVILGMTEEDGYANIDAEVPPRDVRLLDGPAVRDPGQGRVHDGIRQVLARAEQRAAGTHREAPGGEGEALKRPPLPARSLWGEP